MIGANRGIGFQLATRFLKLGYSVHGTYRPQTREDESVAELKKTGIETLELDFVDEVSIKRAAEEFGDKQLDVLINCAGVYQKSNSKPFTELSAEDLTSHFQVNVVGPFLTSKAFLPALERTASGKIINLSSDMATISGNSGGNASYRISKTGLNQLTKTMAVDLQKMHSTVRALAIHPGYLATKMTGYVGKDDMEACMESLVGVIERFGTEAGKAIPTDGGYVRWTGEVMRY